MCFLPRIKWSYGLLLLKYSLLLRKRDFRGFRSNFIFVLQSDDVCSNFSSNDRVCIVIAKTNQSEDAITQKTIEHQSLTTFVIKMRAKQTVAKRSLGMKYLSFKKLRPVTAEREAHKIFNTSRGVVFYVLKHQDYCCDLYWLPRTCGRHIWSVKDLLSNFLQQASTWYSCLI